MVGESHGIGREHSTALTSVMYEGLLPPSFLSPSSFPVLFDLQFLGPESQRYVLSCTTCPVLHHCVLCHALCRGLCSALE